MTHSQLDSVTENHPPVSSALGVALWWETVSLHCNRFFETIHVIHSEFSTLEFADLLLILEIARSRVENTAHPDRVLDARQLLLAALLDAQMGLVAALEGKTWLLTRRINRARRQLVQFQQAFAEMD